MSNGLYYLGGKPCQGDWTCSTCKGHVFKNKMVCKCGQTKNGSKQLDMNKYSWKIGDKQCLKCAEWNFNKNVKCYKCKSDI